MGMVVSLVPTSSPCTSEGCLSEFNSVITLQSGEILFEISKPDNTLPTLNTNSPVIFPDESFIGHVYLTSY